MINLEQLHPQFIIDDMGNKQSVILPIAAFNALLEEVEELAIIAERKNEETTSHNDLVKELKKDGLL